MPKGYLQSPLVTVKYVRSRGIGGRGVFATRDINKGSMIEWAPVILVPDEEIPGGTILHNYAFDWINKIKKKKVCAIALGYVSLYNHSYESNAYYTMEEKDCITVWARKAIPKGSEIFINYNGNPACKNKVGFKVNDGRPNRDQLQKTKSTLAVKGVQRRRKATGNKDRCRQPT